VFFFVDMDSSSISVFTNFLEVSLPAFFDVSFTFL
jgi:hypothetical protein